MKNGFKIIRILGLFGIIITIVIMLFILITDFISDNKYTFIKNDFAVYTIDIGQGDATLIVTPSGEVLVIDSGPTASSDNLINFIDNVVRINNNKIKKIDYAILTHPDEDHCGGFSKLLQKYHVGVFYRPNVLAKNSDDSYLDPGKYSMSDNVHETSTLAYRNAIDSIYNYSDNIIINSNTAYHLNGGSGVGKWTLDINNYGYLDVAGKIDNNYSPIMLLTVMNKRFVFSGDAEGIVLQAFMRDQNNLGIFEMYVDVLMLGHHGSGTNGTNSLDYLEFMINDNKSKNTVILLSVGFNNSYGHPNSAVLERLEVLNIKKDNIYRTDYDSNIVTSIDSNYEINVASVSNDNIMNGNRGYYNATIIIVLGMFVLVPISVIVTKNKKQFKIM